MSSVTTTQPLINPNGAGTVLPATPTPSPVVSNGIGLSTQLIIWGMVGFILVELLAIMCLLRYCCRARYIRKRKYKEKEIILSDSSNIKETKPQYFMGRKTAIINTSQADHEIQHYAVEERQSVSSLHPILTSMPPPQTTNVVCHQETIMIDEMARDTTGGGAATTTTTTTRVITPPPPLAPIYSQPAAGRSTLHVVHHHHLTSSDDESAPPPPPPVTLTEELYTNAADENRMRQELSSEDIYTLRFSTSVAAPLPPPPPPPLSTRDVYEHHVVDEIVTNPRHQQQQSYLYNGTLNRPAFEIISHADVRPVTPITFEHVRELSPRSQAEFDSEYNHYRNNYYPQHQSSHRRKQHHHYHQQQQQQQHPLSFGDERSFAESGERVEWQVAHELRTTDWDRLKELTGAANEPPPGAASSCRYASIDDYERSQQQQRIYERLGPSENRGNNLELNNSRHANNKCSCANINCNSSCKCRRSKLTTANNKLVNNTSTTTTTAIATSSGDNMKYHEQVVVRERDEEYELTNNNAQYSRFNRPTYIDIETVDLRRQQHNQVKEEEDDDDEDEIFTIDELPPPPAQFQQQTTTNTNNNTSTTSRKNSSSVAGMEEALRASNEIDLNNDSISLYTVMNQTPNETTTSNRRFSSSFDAVLGEIKTFKRQPPRSTSNHEVDDRISNNSSSIFNPNNDEAQLY